MTTSGGRTGISEHEIRTELSRVLSSAEFNRSPQLQRFLIFVTNETLAGRRDRLKEYTIGVEVFARPASYDPRLDSLVRVEAKRLRALLDQFYASGGSSDPVRIELPKGSYVPVFHSQAALPVEERRTFAPKRARLLSIGFAAILLLICGILWAHRTKSNSTASPQTIAVLPFENLSSDSDNEYLCFGVMDEVTTDLAKDRNLRVIARTSAAHFKRGDSIASIGQKLKATAILEGSVSKRGDHVRITAQLINVADAVHLWAENYERDGEDPLTVQNEVSREIASAVSARLGGSEAMELPKVQYSRDAEANRLYWKGAYFHSIIGSTNWKENVERSTKYFEQSIEKDPQFASAYAALADAYATLGIQSGGTAETALLMQKAREAAIKALGLDSSLSGAYGVLATVQFSYDYNAASAEKNFIRGLQLNPNDARAHMWYAMALAPQGRFKECLSHAEQARELDPLSFATSNQLAALTYLSRDYERAAKIARETLEIDPRLAPPHILLGMTYEAQEQYAKAVDEYETGLRMAPNHQFGIGRFGHALGKANRRDEALQVAARVETDRAKGEFSNLYAAYIYLGVGDLDRVFNLLEGAYDHHDPDLPYVAVDPIFDSVRSDPRYKSLAMRLGLTK